MMGLALLALPLIYRFSHLPMVESTLPSALRGPLLVWLTPVLLYLLWRRFERVAEEQAAEIADDGNALTDALPKVAQFNVLGSYLRSVERRFFPNGKVSEWQPSLEVMSVAAAEASATGDAATRERLVSGD